MKRSCLSTLLIFSLFFGMCSCKGVSGTASADGLSQVEAHGSGYDGSNGEEISQVQAEESNFSGSVEESYVDITQGGPYGRISVSLPAGWEFELFPMDSEGLLSGMYGIHFYPENVAEGYIELAYCVPFGVCGTGLESETATIAGNPVGIGTYDGHEYWDFISFQEDYEGIVALTFSVEGWWAEYSGQVLDILNTLSFQPSEREGGAYIYHAESEIDTLGLSFSLKNISPTGATLVFNQYDPDAPTGELEFGDDFQLEILNSGKWEEVPVVIEGNYGFNAIAYIISSGECLEKELDWEWIYGELAAGEYRIKKTVHDFRETGNFDKYDVYAHFVLN